MSCPEIWLQTLNFLLSRQLTIPPVRTSALLYSLSGNLFIILYSCLIGILKKNLSFYYYCKVFENLGVNHFSYLYMEFSLSQLKLFWANHEPIEPTMSQLYTKHKLHLNLLSLYFLSIFFLLILRNHVSLLLLKYLTTPYIRHLSDISDIYPTVWSR